MGSRSMCVGSLLVGPVLALMLAGPVAAQEASVVGIWEGALEIPGGGALRLVYNIEVAADGSLTGSIDSPDQGASGIPLSTVTYTNGVFTAVSDAVPGEPTFIATASEDGTTLSGTFSQGDGSLPLELAKR